MTDTVQPVAVFATDIAPRTAASNYPEPFATGMNGRKLSIFDNPPKIAMNRSLSGGPVEVAPWVRTAQS